jgi:hypothetical protein
VRRSLSPSAWCHALSEGSDILLWQLHDEVLVVRPAPSITRNAADQPLAIAVDFDERFLALIANVQGHRLRSALFTLLGIIGCCCWHYEPLLSSEITQQGGT